MELVSINKGEKVVCCGYLDAGILKFHTKGRSVDSLNLSCDILIKRNWRSSISSDIMVGDSVGYDGSIFGTMSPNAIIMGCFLVDGRKYVSLNIEGDFGRQIVEVL